MTLNKEEAQMTEDTGTQVAEEPKEPTSADTGGTPPSAEPTQSNSSLLSNDKQSSTPQAKLNDDIAEFLNPDGTLKESWWEKVGDDQLKENKNWSKYTSITGMIKSLDHFERLAGRKAIAPEDMDDEQKSEFYKRMGVPEKAEDYEIKPPEEMPEDIPYNPEADKWFAEKAKELNLTKGQAQTLHKEFINFQLEQMNGITVQSADAEAQRLVQAEKELRDTFGDEYERTIAQASNLVDKYENDGLRDALERTGAANEPAVIKFLHDVVKATGEDTIIENGKTRGVGMSTQNIEQRIAEIKADPAFANPLDPKFNIVKSEYDRLIGILYK